MDNTFIIIVTYNAVRWLKWNIGRLIESGFGGTIVVVDNMSSDQTVSIIEKKYPSVQLVKNSENLGFGKANNIGLEMALSADARNIILLNQDANIDRSVIGDLDSIATQHPEYGIISPVHLNGSGDKVDSLFNRYIRENQGIELVNDLVLGKKLSNIYEVDFVNAACWFITKRCLEKIGGFDPLFFHYGEDEDYCHRVQYHGFKIGIVPHAFIHHDREGRNTEKDGFLNAYTLNLIEAKNLNEDPKKAWSKIIRRIIRMLLGFLRRGNLREVKKNYRLLKKFRVNKNIIMEHREQSIRQGSTFLS